VRGSLRETRTELYPPEQTCRADFFLAELRSRRPLVFLPVAVARLYAILTYSRVFKDFLIPPQSAMAIQPLIEDEAALVEPFV
jgi:hypothetical protein